MNKTAQWVMCPPQYYGVEYIINPWMKGNIGRTRQDRAQQQWERLFGVLSKYVTVKLIPPEPRLPDMVFTANAGLVHKNVFVPSIFHPVQRQAEEPYFLKWFTQRGFKVKPLGVEAAFEGEGDALFHPGQRLLWAGYGQRTQIEAHAALAKIFNVEVVSLQLVNPSFYHLDTCFAPLADGRIVYYPEAFSAESLATIQARIPASQRLPVNAEDAQNFVCNAVIIGDKYICNKATEGFRLQIQAWGYQLIELSFSEYILAGGAAKCLALCLSNELPALNTASPSMIAVQDELRT